MRKDLLIIAATPPELSGLLDYYGLETDFGLCPLPDHALNIDLLFTGAGSVATVYELSKQIASYKLAVQMGIAGSFGKGHAIGDIVRVKYDAFADFGAWDNQGFHPFKKETFGFLERHPFKNAFLHENCKISIPSLDSLDRVGAITVNSLNTDARVNQMRKNQFNADIETMEGAAFFYVALQEKIPFVQIRAISNYVGERNQENWDIPLAVKVLSDAALQLIEDCAQKRIIL